MTSLPSGRFVALRRREQHPNLLAAWGFDEGSGTIARDSSEQNLSLTVDTGLTWPEGHTGGTSIGNPTGAGSANRSWSISTPITIMGWARPFDLTAGSDRALFGIWSATNANSSTQCAIWAQRSSFGTPNVLQGNVRVNSTLIEVISVPLSVATWYHLALSYDGTTIRLFRDGSEVASTSATGTITPGSFFFCAAPHPTSTRVDDVRVFSAALTATQVAAFMSDPVAP